MTRRPHLLSVSVVAVVVVVVALLAIMTVTAAAQQGDRATTTSREPLRKPPAYAISVHLLFGRLSQTASKSFDAILGTSSGQIFGGGPS